MRQAKKKARASMRIRLELTFAVKHPSESNGRIVIVGAFLLFNSNILSFPELAVVTVMLNK